MDEIIIRHDEAIILMPGEALQAPPDKPLKIRCGDHDSGPNMLDNAEEQLWSSLKQSTGNQVAIYRRGDETRLVCVVPEVARSDTFGFDNRAITTQSRIFKIGVADLKDLFPPEHGDTLEYDNGKEVKIYTVEMTRNDSGTFYKTVGSGKVFVQIHVKEYER